MNIPTQIAPEIEHRLLLSRVEAEELNERDILCPVCGFRIQRVFSDATGHFRVKCRKCKNVNVLNLAYFRRFKRRQSGW
jgi:phage FluMu protein Com